MESNPREKVAQSETWRHKRHPSDATMTKLSVTIKLENTVVFFHWTCTKNTPLTKTLTVYVLNASNQSRTGMTLVQDLGK